MGTEASSSSPATTHALVHHILSSAAGESKLPTIQSIEQVHCQQVEAAHLQTSGLYRLPIGKQDVPAVACIALETRLKALFGFLD